MSVTINLHNSYLYSFVNTHSGQHFCEYTFRTTLVNTHSGLMFNKLMSNYNNADLVELLKELHVVFNIGFSNSH